MILLKKSGIYGNVLGYLGGFSWAVLVANVCKELHNYHRPQDGGRPQPEGSQHPGYDATDVIREFFHLYAKWEWPKPVTLVDIEPKDKVVQQQLEVMEANQANSYSWNPKRNQYDSGHVRTHFR